MIVDNYHLTDLIEDSIHFGKVPTEWEGSIIVSLYKGKGVALERGNYRGLKLPDQVMKVQERMAKKFLRQQVRIDDMQFGFHGRTQHHGRHIYCTPVARKVVCRK